MTHGNRRITADDIYAFEIISDCRISPDGRHVAWALHRVDRKTEKKRANIWIAPTGGGRPRQFTRGDQTDASPRWSPDGREIAFLSNRGTEDQPQVCIIPFDGGEARKLTDLKGDFSHLQWAPDGRRLVFAFRKKDAAEIEREKDERKKKLGIVSRRVTRAFYKLDGRGYLPSERQHIWTADARTGRTRQLTAGDVADESDPAISPDGRWIVYVSNRAPEPDLEPEADDVFVIAIDGGDERKVATPYGPMGLPSISPAGDAIAYVGVEGRGPGGRNVRLWIVPFDGSSPARDLTGRYDVNVEAATLADLTSVAMTPPTWMPDGSRILFPVARRGNTEILSIRPDGADLATIIDGTGVAGSFTLDRAGTRIAYIRGTLADPCQCHVRELATGRDRALTTVNRRLLAGIDLGAVEEVWFRDADDSMDLQGWILTPPDFDPRKRYPAIVEIHGGPHLQYGNLFMHEFHYLAAHGYVVAFSNPRGGQGYGEKHGLAIANAWGTADYADVMKWADLVAARSYVDAGRMGVTGGSYGGFLTNWIVGHTDRFRAAVTQRSVSNLVSMYGSSDFNWAFQREFGDRPPWEDFENWWRQSPIAHIGGAKTPTLVVHNENDLRCAIEQGEQVFAALKRLGVPTEMVRFPDESHGLSRGGRTDRRIVRIESILGWFERYLKG